MGNLEGRTALVTGGSRGIGRAICLRLANDGADIAINYAKSADAANEVAEEVRALGRHAEVYQADVADREAVNAMAEQAIARVMRRGLRQARYRGRRKVQFQALTAALITNLVRFTGLERGESTFCLA